MKQIPLALGLFSVRTELQKDWKKALRDVKEMGYEGVEFFGPMRYPVEELKAELEKNGLALVGWHVGFADITEDAVAYNRALGNNKLVVPALPAEDTNSADAWRETAKKFNEKAQYLKGEGFLLGYHNHETEFQPLDGEIPWDIFATATEGNVFLQLDNGNALAGGADTVALFEKYPKRGITVHFKPYSKATGFNTMIGDDDIPWRETFEVLDAQGVTEWYVVEYECEEAYTQLAGAKAAIDALRKMGL
ncbi:MAG: sugar phosphate isomerase/epimerase family protein [Christensenellales bacterium]|jgi:sugar phosphate isomerase/epimerase